MNEVFAENLFLWILFGTVGGVFVGWWLCKKIKFGEAAMRVHEQQLRETLDRAAFGLEQSRMKQQKFFRNVGNTTLHPGQAVARVPGGVVAVTPQESSGIDPLTLVTAMLTHDHMKSQGQHTVTPDDFAKSDNFKPVESAPDVWHAPTHHDAPAHDSGCSSHHDSGSSDSGSSSSDCGSSDSGSPSSSD